MSCPFILWGGTGQAKVLHEALLHLNANVVLIVDNRDIPSPLPNIPIVQGIEGLDIWLSKNKPEQYYGLAAVGGNDGNTRLCIMGYFKERGIINYTVIHKTAFVAADASVGEGSQILAQSSVCTHAVIGRGVIINTSASVDHDSCVEDGVHVAPGAKLAGEVHVGRYAFIGTGAVILPRIKIGESSIIGAGAVVTHDVPAGIAVVGNPARQHKI